MKSDNVAASADGELRPGLQSEQARTIRDGRAAHWLRRFQWIQWLSLEAVAIALVWQDLLARALDATLHASSRVMLALAVWLIYAGDRWLDGWKLAADARAGAVNAAARHAFARDHKLTLGGLWILALVGAIAGSVRWLSGDVRRLGFWVLAATVTYLILRHTAVLPRTGGARWIKPATIAVVFAWGTALAPLTAHTHATPSDFAALGCWLAACLLNCIAIASWEDECRERQLERPPNPGGIRISAAAIGIAVAAACTGFRMPTVALTGVCFSTALTAAGVLLLDANRWRIDLSNRRLLADAALLTPLLFTQFDLSP